MAAPSAVMSSNSNFVALDIQLWPAFVNNNNKNITNYNDNNNIDIVLYIQITHLFMLVCKLSKLQEPPNWPTK